VWLRLDAPIDATLLALSAAVLTAAAALAFAPRLEHHAARLALPALVVQLVASFPLAPNHFFVELYAVGLLALAGRDARDAPLVLAGLRFTTALVLFHTGLQKVLYGHYFHGDFLAFMVGSASTSGGPEHGDRFADLFAWILPRSEVLRLQGYDPFRDGAGPYRVAQPLFVALSNAIWIAELLLPIGLLRRSTRTVAVLAALALVLAIQLGAREMGFALVFVNLLLLFAPASWALRALPFSGAILLLALAAGGLGLAPGWVERWHLW
jgi:hypothetical protein